MIILFFFFFFFFSFFVTPKPTTSRCCPLWAFPFRLTFKVFKTCLLGRGFPHPYKGCYILLPDRCGISHFFFFFLRRLHVVFSSPRHLVVAGGSIILLETVYKMDFSLVGFIICCSILGFGLFKFSSILNLLQFKPYDRCFLSNLRMLFFCSIRLTNTNVCRDI